MSAIGPGDWVECVRMDGTGVGPYWRLSTQHARVGGIYQVEDIIPGFLFDDGVDALVLVQIPGQYPDGQRYAYCITRFRPIWRGDKSLIETLLAPLPAGVEPVSEPPTPVTPREPMQARSAAHPSQNAIPREDH